MAKYNFLEEEKKWQDFWFENKIFAYEKKSSKPIFSVDTPPPTVSGKLHMGHVFSYTHTEVIARYFRLADHNVFYPIGMDDNGLPTDKLAEKELEINSKNLPKNEYIKKVQNLVSTYHKIYTDLFNSLGFSYDWNLLYSTISPEIQKLTIDNFHDFVKRDIIYKKKAPSLWCPLCHTGLAQAEVEDQESNSIFYDLQFGDLVISTTRPELLPACVAIFVNPSDQRYKKLIGQFTTTPLGDKVKIYADELAKIDKGTGAVMCCTYGDETDLFWKNKHNLEEKIIIDEDGTINGLSIKEARQKIIDDLKSKNLVLKEISINHDIGVHERCGTPVELILQDQYFVKVLDIKKDILLLADKINWFPRYMKSRFINWVENLKWDWCISRNRFYGIPVPGEENLVFDTWFTSSNTPEILSNQGGKIPYSLRPQAHDIIRTWAFYTLVMSYYKNKDIPWKNIAISGHILLRKGEKISKKTGGGNLRPEEQISLHSADAIRWAMTGNSLGADGYYEEKEIDMGKKIVNKLFNAGNFVCSALKDLEPSKISDPLDIYMVQKSKYVAQKMSEYFKKFDYSHPRDLIQNFFWNDFCDYYLEIIKKQVYDNGSNKQSVLNALNIILKNILIMFTPFIPHITENIYQSFYKNKKSINLELWPELDSEFKNENLVDNLFNIISLVRGQKTKDGKNLATSIDTLTIYSPLDLNDFIQNIKDVTRSENIILNHSDETSIEINYTN
jgi:valyl-tRNA synthetase